MPPDKTDPDGGTNPTKPVTPTTTLEEQPHMLQSMFELQQGFGRVENELRSQREAFREFRADVKADLKSHGDTINGIQKVIWTSAGTIGVIVFVVSTLVTIVIKIIFH